MVSNKYGGGDLGDWCEFWMVDGGRLQSKNPSFCLNRWRKGWVIASFPVAADCLPRNEQRGAASVYQ
jgi:hypothetical protein